MSSWGNRKPPFGTPVNWSHPLVRGLVGHWLCAEKGGTTLFSSALGPQLSFHSGSNGNPTWSPGLGLSTTSQGQTAYGTAGALLKLSVPLTIVLQGKSTGTQTNCSLFGVTYQAIPDATPFWGYMLGTNTSHSALDFTYNKAGSGTSLQSSGTTPVLTTGTKTQIAGRIMRNSGNGKVSLWKDGSQVLSADVLTLATINYGTNPVVGFGDITNFTASNFISDFGSIYNYDLSNDFLRWLYTEPYDLFEFPQRPRYASNALVSPIRLAGIGGGMAGPIAHLAGNR